MVIVNLQSYEGSEKKVEEITVINVPLEPNSAEADFCFKAMHPDWLRLPFDTKITK